MKLKYLVTIASILLTGNSYAGIFGASNYDECVLEKMKGQDRSLIYTARSACATAFPPEPVEQMLDTELIGGKWCDSSGTEQKYCITKLPKNYKLTTATGIFFTDVCEGKQTKPGVEIVSKKDLFSNEFTFKTPYAKYQCAKFTVFGFIK